MAGQSFLDRFRPLGAPGAATASGVPAVDSLGVAAELAPVFAALAGQVEEAAALVRAAEDDAGRELAQVRERARAIVAQARIDVAAEQARAAAGVFAAASARDADITAAAEATATASPTTRVTDVVQAVIDRLLADLLVAR